MRSQKHLPASLSSAGVGFKRVGLHYIAFSQPAIAKTRLVSLPTSKIAGLGISVTNFGWAWGAAFADTQTATLNHWRNKVGSGHGFRRAK
jgi:hypothetical protein